LLLDSGEARPARFPRFEAEPDEPGRAAGRGAARAGGRPEAPPGDALSPDALRQAARVEGYQAGRAEGRADAQAEWSARLAALAQSLDAAARALLARRIDLAAEVDRQLPRLAFTLARKVLHRELGQPDTAARTAVRAVSERLAGCDRPMALRLHPDAAAALEAARQSGRDDETLALALRIDPDPALGPGDWLMETHDGFLDGRVEAQLETAWRLCVELQ
jgi:flagellar assembly protein FliH